MLNFRNEIYGLPLVLIDNLRVNPSCTDIAVAEKFGNGVEVCSVGQCEGGERMAAPTFVDTLHYIEKGFLNGLAFRYDFNVVFPRHEC